MAKSFLSWNYDGQSQNAYASINVDFSSDINQTIVLMNSIQGSSKRISAKYVTIDNINNQWPIRLKLTPVDFVVPPNRRVTKELDSSRNEFSFTATPNLGVGGVVSITFSQEPVSVDMDDNTRLISNLAIRPMIVYRGFGSQAALGLVGTGFKEFDILAGDLIILFTKSPNIATTINVSTYGPSLLGGVFTPNLGSGFGGAGAILQSWATRALVDIPANNAAVDVRANFTAAAAAGETNTVCCLVIRNAFVGTPISDSFDTNIGWPTQGGAFPAISHLNASMPLNTRSCIAVGKDRLIIDAVTAPVASLFSSWTCKRTGAIDIFDGFGIGIACFETQDQGEIWPANATLSPAVLTNSISGVRMVVKGVNDVR